MKKLVPAMALLAMLSTGLVANAATSYSTDFEDFTLGKLSAGATAQNGWSGGAQGGFTNNDALDEEIQSTEVHSGTKAWRYSQGYGSPGQGTPYTPVVENGDGNGVSKDGDKFSASLWFKAVSATPDNQVIKITTGTADGTDRGNYLAYLKNEVGGIHLYSFNGGTSFSPVDLFTGVSTADWHKLDITLTKLGFVDTVTVALDGGPAVSYNSALNEWRQSIGAGYADSSRLKFAAAEDGGNYQGFYFDDISYSVSSASPAVPEPASVLLGLMGLAPVIGFAKLRRK